MASLIYNDFKEKILNGSIDLDTDTIKVALVTSSYTPDKDAHDFFDDVTNEVSGTGYTAGGATLSVTISQDNTNDRGVFDAVDTSWTSASIANVYAAVVYKSTGTASTSPLIAYIDLNSETAFSVVNGTLTITWNSSGILYLA